MKLYDEKKPKEALNLHCVGGDDTGPVSELDLCVKESNYLLRTRDRFTCVKETSDVKDLKAWCSKTKGGYV